MDDTDPYGDDAGWVPGPAEPLEPGADQAPAPTLYPDLPTWVSQHLAQVARRRLGGSLTWCRLWWRHAEAVSRLNSLWQEWERARTEGTLSAWWIYHAGPHLDALMSRDNGPFMACRPNEDDDEDGHSELPPLPCETPDPALWLGSAYSDPDTASGVSAATGPGASDVEGAQ